MLSDELHFQGFEPESRLSKLQGWALSNRWALSVAGLGVAFMLVAIFTLNTDMFKGEKVEILGSSSQLRQGSDGQASLENKITVEIAGEVQKPSVYELKSVDRVEQLLVISGGFTAIADREWVEKNLNRASKLTDGQKIYIPKKGEISPSLSQSSSQGVGLPAQRALVNINSASLAQLDALPGIGAVRAQSVISNRPYMAIDELLSRKVLPSSVFNKVKDQITI